LAADLGATPSVGAAIAAANTGLHALELAREAGIPLADAVAAGARATAVRALDGAAVEVEVLVVDRGGAIVGEATF
jgi:cobalt-precorrin-5B (C1)-methyltransferase